MAILKLTKVERRAEEAAYAFFKDSNGDVEQVQIPLNLYHGLSSHPEVHALRPDKTLTGGYTRYDYETPTGLLGEGEYGDDGVDDLGNPEYQVVLGGDYITINKEKIVKDEIDLDDAQVVEKFGKKGIEKATLESVASTLMEVI
jgi:hypothetical protein